MFSRKQNLERHQKKHDDENNQHCPECLNVFTREDALDKHLHQQHGWTRVKGSLDTEDGGSAAKRRRLDLREGPRSLYNLEKTGERKIEKFRTTASYYKVNVRDLEIQGLPNILKSLKTMFQSIIEDITEMIPDTDLV